MFIERVRCSIARRRRFLVREISEVFRIVVGVAVGHKYAGKKVRVFYFSLLEAKERTL